MATNYIFAEKLDIQKLIDAQNQHKLYKSPGLNKKIQNFDKLQQEGTETAHPIWDFKIDYDLKTISDKQRRQIYFDQVKNFNDQHDNYFKRNQQNYLQNNQVHPQKMEDSNQQSKIDQLKSDAFDNLQQEQQQKISQICSDDIVVFQFNLLALINVAPLNQLSEDQQKNKKQNYSYVRQIQEQIANKQTLIVKQLSQISQLVKQCTQNKVLEQLQIRKEQLKEAQLILQKNQLQLNYIFNILTLKRLPLKKLLSDNIIENDQNLQKLKKELTNTANGIIMQKSNKKTVEIMKFAQQYQSNDIYLFNHVNQPELEEKVKQLALDKIFLSVYMYISKYKQFDQISMDQFNLQNFYNYLFNIVSNDFVYLLKVEKEFKYQIEFSLNKKQIEFINLDNKFAIQNEAVRNFESKKDRQYIIDKESIVASSINMREEVAPVKVIQIKNVLIKKKDNQIQQEEIELVKPLETSQTTLKDTIQEDIKVLSNLITIKQIKENEIDNVKQIANDEEEDEIMKVDAEKCKYVEMQPELLDNPPSIVIPYDKQVIGAEQQDIDETSTSKTERSKDDKKKSRKKKQKFVQEIQNEQNEFAKQWEEK